MNQNLRKIYILETVEKTGKVSINQIVKKFDIAGMTARRDIAELVERGYLNRIHGGAVKNDPLSNMFSFSRRVDRNKEKKNAIGRRAASFVKDHDTIYIDSGTTTVRMCQFLKMKKGLRIITNSLPAATELINYSDWNVILIGGKIVPERRSIYGPTAVQQVSNYHVLKAFIGTEGVSITNGLTAYDSNESNVSKTVSTSSDQVFLLCDSSKIEKTSFYKFLSLSDIDVLITDNGIEKKTADDYLAANTNLVIA
ncbi:DeoR/GlpR transcriptional regulator [bacterium]|nr:DeoR/GlpR transcriptional regulator [bacterium]